MLDILGLEPGSEFWRTVNKYGNQKERLLKAIEKFIEWKNAHPFNGALPGKFPGFGSNDKKFESKGLFGNEYAHAHITHNISVVYAVDRGTNTLKIYGVYAHDDIGTGTPANRNRQAQAQQRWDQQSFDANQAVTGVDIPDEKKEKPVVKKEPSKFDYTKKEKPVQPAPKQQSSEESQLRDLISMIDSKWPDRGFKNRLNNSLTLQDKLAFINSEMQYIMLIKRKGMKLYPNQLEYVKGLEFLTRHLIDKQRKPK